LKPPPPPPSPTPVSTIDETTAKVVNDNNVATPTGTMCHGTERTARPILVVQCSGNYEHVKKKNCTVCEGEAKNQFPRKSMRELRKTKNNLGHNIIRCATRGCNNCNVAVCQEHWPNYQRCCCSFNDGQNVNKTDTFSECKVISV